MAPIFRGSRPIRFIAFNAASDAIVIAPSSTPIIIALYHGSGPSRTLWRKLGEPFRLASLALTIGSILIRWMRMYTPCPEMPTSP